MSLREEFEIDIKKDKINNIQILFEINNQNYINWLENKVKLLQDSLKK